MLAVNSAEDQKIFSWRVKTIDEIYFPSPTFLSLNYFRCLMDVLNLREAVIKLREAY
jgi:hypothetical protein